MQSSDWVSRLVAEAAQHSAAPLFCLLTYASPPETADQSTIELQKFFKRMRKRYGPCRYFCATERGEKRGRLHHHVILWNDHLASLKWWPPRLGNNPPRNLAVQAAWKHGFVNAPLVRHCGGLKYSTKYITKDGQLLHSNRPRMGAGTFDAYSAWLSAAHAVRPFETIRSLPTALELPNVLGQRWKLYIPTDERLRLAKNLGVAIRQPEDETWSSLLGAPGAGKILPFNQLAVKLQARSTDGDTKWLDVVPVLGDAAPTPLRQSTPQERLESWCRLTLTSRTGSTSLNLGQSPTRYYGSPANGESISV